MWSCRIKDLLLWADILRHQIFFVGEDHEQKKNGDSLILQYIASNKTSIHLLVEEPQSMESSIRKYVYEGDTSAYQYLFRSFLYNPEEEMCFLREVRLLVKSGYSVKISAIDIEGNFNLTVKRLRELIPTKIPLMQIEKITNNIKHFSRQYSCDDLGSIQ